MQEETWTISLPSLPTPSPGFLSLSSSEKTKVEAVAEVTVNVLPSPPVHSVHSTHLDDLLSMLKAENENLKQEKKDIEQIFLDRLSEETNNLREALKKNNSFMSEAKIFRDKMRLLESQIATLKEEKVDLSILNDSLRQEASKKKLYAESLEEQRKTILETLDSSKIDATKKFKNLEIRVGELEESIKIKDRVLAETLEEILKKNKKIDSLKMSMGNSQTDPV